MRQGSGGASGSASPTTPQTTTTAETPVDFAVPGSPPKQAQAVPSVVPTAVASVQAPPSAYPMPLAPPTMHAMWMHPAPGMAPLVVAGPVPDMSPLTCTSSQVTMTMSPPTIQSSASSAPIQPFLPLRFWNQGPVSVQPTYGNIQKTDWKAVLPHMQTVPTPWEANGVIPVDNGWRSYPYSAQVVPRSQPRSSSTEQASNPLPSKRSASSASATTSRNVSTDTSVGDRSSGKPVQSTSPLPAMGTGNDTKVGFTLLSLAFFRLQTNMSHVKYVFLTR